MILVKFLKSDNNIIGFTMSGHADYDEYGMDIVCSAVTSSVQLTCNGITEILRLKCSLSVEENAIEMTLNIDDAIKAETLLKSLQLHLTILSEDYKENIELINMEV